VVDFDQVTRDPAHPDRLLPAYDSGDHLHPGPAGYKAMGEAIPLTLFVP
jgi:lysophospholipase L1-like esterase